MVFIIVIILHMIQVRPVMVHNSLTHRFHGQIAEYTAHFQLHKNCSHSPPVVFKSCSVMVNNNKNIFTFLILVRGRYAKVYSLVLRHSRPLTGERNVRTRAWELVCVLQVIR